MLFQSHPPPRHIGGIKRCAAAFIDNLHNPAQVDSNVFLLAATVPKSLQHLLLIGGTVGAVIDSVHRARVYIDDVALKPGFLRSWMKAGACVRLPFLEAQQVNVMHLFSDAPNVIDVAF